MTAVRHRVGGRLLRVSIVLALIGGVLAAIWWLLLREDGVEAVVASGTVEARQAHVGFKTAGRIDTLAVDEGDEVAAAERLASLDREEIRARLAAARAGVEEARARLGGLLDGFRPEEIAEARAAVEAQRERLQQALAELARTRLLFGTGAVAEEALEQDRTEAEVARAQLEEARARLERLEAGYTAEEIAERRAVLRQARAAVEEVQATLDDATLRAPFAGVVSVRHRTEGEIVSAGQPVFTIMDPADRWVRAYIAEDEIGRVYLGQPALITSDTYEDELYAGVVTFIANEAEFTPRNIQTEEERVKLVYAIEVAIIRDPEFHLHPGIPADVVLEPRSIRR